MSSGREGNINEYRVHSHMPPCGRTRMSMSMETLRRRCNEVMMTSPSNHGHRDETISSANESVSSDRTFVPSENISPGHRLYVLLYARETRGDAKKEEKKKKTIRWFLKPMVWGLIPSYTKLSSGEKPSHWKMFNARSESVTLKPSFARLMKRGRCAIPLQGFYEWQHLSNGKKQPFYLTASHQTKPSDDDRAALALSFRTKDVFFVAGLFDTWTNDDVAPLHTFTILTMDASKAISHIHDRQPVCLSRRALEMWMDCENVAPEEALRVARVSGRRATLRFHPVGHKMTNPRYNGADCSTHIDDSASSIKRWFSGARNVAKLNDKARERTDDDAVVVVPAQLKRESRTTCASVHIDHGRRESKRMKPSRKADTFLTKTASFVSSPNTKTSKRTKTPIDHKQAKISSFFSRT